ncbi:MAG: hypothetical protein FWD22_05655, partial [Treponema sp.]|nr:hypothetical protein [Treponema sp.]
ATQSQTAMYIPEDGEEFVFKLEMIDSATGNVLGRQSIIYVTPDASVSELLSIIIYNMLSGIPDTYHSTDWRDKLFFFDITALWMPRIYYAEYQSINWLNFGLRLGGELHFAKFMSLGIAAQVTQDWVVLASAGIEEYRDLVLEIPASLKLVFKPADYYMVEPYGGVSWNYSIRGITEPSVMSWFAGLQFGIRSGSGMIVFDPRFSMDFYNSKLPERNVEYQRYCIQFGIGYKVGAAQKRFRIQEY